MLGGRIPVIRLCARDPGNMDSGDKLPSPKGLDPLAEDEDKCMPLLLLDICVLDSPPLYCGVPLALLDPAATTEYGKAFNV